MRKVIVSMNLTLDGFMAGPNWELDWHFSYWNDEMAEEAAQQLSKADTILLGRITYNAMAQYWPLQRLNFSFARQDIPFADMMNSHKKIVFSKTLHQTNWHNSLIIKGNMNNNVIQLKKQPGKDIIVFGSGSIVSALVQSGLIDEYQLWIHPLALGDGKLLFKSEKAKPRLKLIRKKEFLSGVKICFYVPDCP